MTTLTVTAVNKTALYTNRRYKKKEMKRRYKKKNPSTTHTAIKTPESICKQEHRSSWTQNQRVKQSHCCIDIWTLVWITRMKSPESTGSYQVSKNMCGPLVQKKGDYFSQSKGTVSCSKKKKKKSLSTYICTNALSKWFQHSQVS